MIAICPMQSFAQAQETILGATTGEEASLFQEIPSVYGASKYACQDGTFEGNSCFLCKVLKCRRSSDVQFFLRVVSLMEAD